MQRVSRTCGFPCPWFRDCCLRFAIFHVLAGAGPHLRDHRRWRAHLLMKVQMEWRRISLWGSIGALSPRDSFSSGRRQGAASGSWTNRVGARRRLAKAGSAPPAVRSAHVCLVFLKLPQVRDSRYSARLLSAHSPPLLCETLCPAPPVAFICFP